MESIADEQQLLRACAVLFGDEVQLSRDFLHYIQPGGLKSAFRKRALETHPDLAAAGSWPQSGADATDFLRAREAFEQLHRFVQNRTGPLPASPMGRTGEEQAPFHAGRVRPENPMAAGALHAGPLPHRRLLFGHFLYYSGLTDWRTIVRVLIRQRTERPRLGELGLCHGLLRSEDIPLILRCQEPAVPFGQTAMHLGLLDEQQVHALLVRQQRLHKKFGAILLENNLLTPRELAELLVRFNRHNIQYSRPWRR